MMVDFGLAVLSESKKFLQLKSTFCFFFLYCCNLFFASCFVTASSLPAAIMSMYLSNWTRALCPRNTHCSITAAYSSLIRFRCKDDLHRACKRTIFSRPSSYSSSSYKLFLLAIIHKSINSQ